MARQRGKFPPVVIGDPEAPPTQLLPQDPILFDQVRQHLSLTPVQPPGDREQQHLDGRDVDHVWELSARLESALPTRSAETWDTTGSRHHHDVAGLRPGLERLVRAADPKPGALHASVKDATDSAS